MQKLVSIIIPNYNHESFLQKRLQTVLEQTYQNFEIIILDDASSDKSLTILNQYKNHSKVSHFIVNKKNSGSPFIQWGKGINLAKGDLIWIAESDDFSDLFFLEKSITLFNQDDKLSLVFCNSNLQNLYLKSDIISNLTTKTGVYENTNNNFLCNWFFNNSEFRILNASSCVFKKNVIDNNVLNIIKNHRYSGDKLFWASILLKNPKFGYISEPLNFHTFHENTTRSKSTISSNSIRNKEILEIYDYCGFLKTINKNSNQKKEIGFRFLMYAVYEFILNKNLKVKQFFKGLYFIQWNKPTLGKVYRNIMLDK
jgi:glycosyltransferase involved in cell wall biosynthesis